MKKRWSLPRTLRLNTPIDTLALKIDKLAFSQESLKNKIEFLASKVPK